MPAHITVSIALEDDQGRTYTRSLDVSLADIESFPEFVTAVARLTRKIFVEFADRVTNDPGPVWARLRTVFPRGGHTRLSPR